ncbi:hypothetical protein [Streptococcus equi]|uniref:hypothetical protein n=1 Tax=Streptococcus equi TaxID=1336 RepID=UPI001E622D04|nr:hypothetical protein [Streptococcus equi]
MLDETKTAMGMRLLRTWIDRPLVTSEAILERQEIIQVFLNAFIERTDLSDSLKGVMTLSACLVVYLLEKQTQGSITARSYLAKVPYIKAILEAFNSPYLDSLSTKLTLCLS